MPMVRAGSPDGTFPGRNRTNGAESTQTAASTWLQPASLPRLNPRCDVSTLSGVRGPHGRCPVSALPMAATTVSTMAPHCAQVSDSPSVTNAIIAVRAGSRLVITP